MSRHARAAYDWGFAAVTTVCVILAVAAGVAFGAWLALAGITEDPTVATRTIVRAAAVVAMAVTVLLMARRVVRYRRVRRQR